MAYYMMKFLALIKFAE